MEVHLVRQKASELQKNAYDSRHTTLSTAIVPNTNTRVGTEDIPGIPDMTAGVRMTAGCNSTITFQVIGGKKEGGISGSPDSKNDEKLSIGYKGKLCNNSSNLHLLLQGLCHNDGHNLRDMHICWNNHNFHLPERLLHYAPERKRGEGNKTNQMSSQNSQFDVFFQDSLEITTRSSRA